MKLPRCSRCNQPRTPEQLRRGICGACRRHRCEKHQPGTPTCYKRDKCRCDDCRNAYSDQARKQRHYLRTGRPGRVPADLAKKHYERLRLHLTPDQIEKASGIAYGTLKRLPHVSMVYRGTAEAILSVPIPAVAAADNQSLVPAIGAQRRIQALVANGWSMRRLVTELGLTHGASGWMSPARETIQARTHHRAVALYERLWNESPPERCAHEKKAASRARNLAQSRHWAPPLAWDDDMGPHGIDNPSATPFLDDAAETTFERIKWLVDGGQSLATITSQLGITESAVEKACRRSAELGVWERINIGRRAA